MRLKTTLIWISLAAALIGGQASAQSVGVAGHDFGFGLGLGRPTSLTGKYWLDSKLALDFAFDLAGPLGFHGDILFHTRSLTHSGDVDLPLYLGVGPSLGYWYGGWYWGWPGPFAAGPNFFSVGARVPFGIDILLKRIPMEVYVELGPEIWFLPGPWFDILGTVGFRYYF